MTPEHVPETAPLVDVLLDEHGVPHRGVTGRQAEGALLPAASDHDWWPRLLYRLGLVARLSQGEELTVVVGRVLGEETIDDLGALLESGHPLTDRAQVEAIRVGFDLVPTGAQAQLQPSSDVLLPYFVGGLLPGIVTAIAVYYLVRPIVAAYQAARRHRRLVRAEARLAAQRARAYKAGDNDSGADT